MEKKRTSLQLGAARLLLIYRDLQTASSLLDEEQDLM